MKAETRLKDDIYIYIYIYIIYIYETQGGDSARPHLMAPAPLWPQRLYGPHGRYCWVPNLPPLPSLLPSI